jgi:hypothetical protein
MMMKGVKVSALRASKRWGYYRFHALTDVATEYRPFGPEISESHYDIHATRVAPPIVQNFLKFVGTTP